MYAVNPNPNQQFRRTLAERIGLTEEQVNVSSSGLVSCNDLLTYGLNEQQQVKGI